MANFSNLITTTKGHELVTKILAGEIATEPQSPFTRIVTSSAVYQMSELESLIDLTEIQQETLVSSVTKQNQTTIEIHGGMNNSQLTVGYRLNTIGVYFRAPDDPQEYLFGAAIHTPTHEEPSADFIFPFNGLTTTGLLFDLLASVGNADKVPMKVDPAAVVTIKTLLLHNISPTAHENRFAAIQAQLATLIGHNISGTVATVLDLLPSADLPQGTIFLVLNDETQNGAASIYKVDAAAQWMFVRKLTSTVLQDDINQIIQDITRLNTSIGTRMLQAPIGAVHGAMGDRWYALEGTELRAVITVSEDVNFAKEPGIINISEEDFDSFEMFTVTHKGARVTFEKNEPETTLYQSGAGLMVYKFVFNPDERTITITETRIEVTGTQTNPNILHNWDFRNPVNQRGLVEYGEQRYTIDRWLAHGSARFSILSGFCRLARTDVSGFAPIDQRLEYGHLLRGKTVTLSIQTVDGNIHAITSDVPMSGEFSISSTGTFNGTPFGFLFRNAGALFYVRIFFPDGTPVGSQVDIVAVKLELGTVSTLANDPPMDFGRELTTCRRYFQRLRINQVAAPRFAPGTAAWHLSTQPMRINPTVALHGTPNTVNTYFIGRQPGNNLIPGVTYGFITRSNEAIDIRAYHDSITATDVITFWMNPSGGGILLSADL